MTKESYTAQLEADHRRALARRSETPPMPWGTRLEDSDFTIEHRETNPDDD